MPVKRVGYSVELYYIVTTIKWEEVKRRSLICSEYLHVCPANINNQHFHGL